MSPGRSAAGADGRWRWAVRLVVVIAVGYACAFFFGFLQAAAALAADWTSTAPVAMTLHADAVLAVTTGTHSYSGGAYIADGTLPTATEVTALVSGLGRAARIASGLGPLLQSVTLIAVALLINTTALRIVRPNVARTASRMMIVAAAVLAVGTTLAQAVTGWSRTQVGDVSWIGQHGIDGFTAVDTAWFDPTPLAVAVGFVAIACVLVRHEQAVAPGKAALLPAAVVQLDRPSYD